jgi:hypothetical protein
VPTKKTILCPHFVQNKYVPGTNNYLPQRTRAPPQGARHTVWEPLVYCNVMLKISCSFHSYKTGNKVSFGTIISNTTSLTIVLCFEYEVSLRLWIGIHLAPRTIIHFRISSFFLLNLEHSVDTTSVWTFVTNSWILLYVCVRFDWKDL